MEKKISWYLFAEKNTITSKTASYLCTIYMLIYILREELQEGNLYEMKKLQNINSIVIMINTYISSLIMEYDFKQNSTIDFQSNRLFTIIIKI